MASTVLGRIFVIKSNGFSKNKVYTITKVGRVLVLFTFTFVSHYMKLFTFCYLMLQIFSCASYSTASRSNKIYESAKEAVSDIQDGSKLLVGGFGLCGIPENLIVAVKDKRVSGLTVVSNNAGEINLNTYFINPLIACITLICDTYFRLPTALVVLLRQRTCMITRLPLLF